MNKNFVRAALAGLVATAAMTMLMLVGPMMGMPKMPIGEMLASFMSIPVALGWIAHFMIGVILGFIYATSFAERLIGHLVYGAVLGGVYGKGGRATASVPVSGIA